MRQREVDPRTDCDLTDAVRCGDREAFSELYLRHRESAHRFARILLGTEQGADDLVAEAFTKVFQRLVLGGGPSTGFRSYVVTTVRTTLYKHASADRMVDHHAEVPELRPADDRVDPVLTRFEAAVTARAYRSLPHRWQLVLRYQEIEGMTIAAVADRLDMQANAVSALAFRARDALRVAYLQMHINPRVPDMCVETTAHLASWLCGRLNRTTRSRVHQHLAVCTRCTGIVHELRDIIAQMRRAAPLAGVRSLHPAVDCVPAARSDEDWRPLRHADEPESCAALAGGAVAR
ncbi:MAG TPA: sigma-70 family RNA polymerase sigma factor [Pseudonocardiaceae bacterium]|nr:sigma-70 family RNA polymerase sigma factor [Pseudonocardiaceae bacterium]